MTLAQKESELKSQMQKHVRQIVKSKPILLYKQMLRAINYPDIKAADLMSQGFPIVGDMDITGVFETRNEADVIQGADPIWLMKQARLARKSIIQQIEGTPCDHILQGLYSKTVTDEDSEINQGWASGPFTEEEIIKRRGPLFLPCRRFGVEQGEDDQGNPKIRPIDDFSEHFHNSCVTMVDKITVSGIDGIANFIKLWAECLWWAKPNRAWRFSLSLTDGTVLSGTLHPSLRSHENHRLVKVH